MADANDLLNTIKQAAKEAMEAQKPTTVLFGKVTNISPIQINVEQKMTLGEAQLILTRNVTDFETDVTINWSTDNRSLNANHNHEMSGDIQVDSSSSVPITNTVINTMAVNQRNIDLTHNHGITGRKKMKIHNGLQVGDKVVLLRIQGGQQYIVIDRVV